MTWRHGNATGKERGGIDRRCRCLLRSADTRSAAPPGKALRFPTQVSALSASLEDWQACRSLRNRAAHAYGTDYTETAGHFNAMRAQIGFLTGTIVRISAYVRESLQIQAADESFLRDLAGGRKVPHATE